MPIDKKADPHPHEPAADDRPIISPERAPTSPEGRALSRIPLAAPSPGPHPRRGRDSQPSHRAQAVDPRRRRSPASRFRG